jgi:hypothetical protein
MARKTFAMPQLAVSKLADLMHNALKGAARTGGGERVVRREGGSGA